MWLALPHNVPLPSADVAFRVRLDWALQAVASKPEGYWMAPATSQISPPLLAWAEGAGLSRVVADAVQRGTPKTFGGDVDTNPEAPMCAPPRLDTEAARAAGFFSGGPNPDPNLNTRCRAFLKSLKSRQELADILCSPTVLDAMVHAPRTRPFVRPSYALLTHSYREHGARLWTVPLIAF